MPLDDQTELFYLVDQNDQVLGSVPRELAHSSPNHIHRAVDIILTNQKRQILLQLRSPHKDTHPNHWTISASGHVTFGQTYHQAAHRELQEELGLDLPLSPIGHYLCTFPNETEYATLYWGQTEITPTHFDPTEVSAVTWVDLDSIDTFINSHPFSPGPIESIRLFHNWYLSSHQPV